MQFKHWLIIAVVVLAMLLVADRCEAAGDYAQYENAMRALTIRRMLHHDACRTAPEARRGVCFARVDAEWRKALANAWASYQDTPQGWLNAAQVAREADARVKRIEGMK